MGGGVMQLIAVGAQDVFLSGSPEMSFFKMVYRRHTNFSMESVRQTFFTKPTLDTRGNTFTCRITRIADLLQDVFISVQLPNIYSNESLRFKWIENIANYMIYSYTLKIDTQTIDIVWGEWMDIWNELTLSADKKDGYNRMTGNVEEFMKPKSEEPSVRYNNNRITYFSYPTAGTTIDKPSIPSRRLYIPIPFWFSKNPGLALPLIALQYQNIDVVIEVKNIEELYQVYDEQTAMYYSPMGYRELITERNRILRTATLNGTMVNSKRVIDNTYDDDMFNADVSIQRFLVPINQSYENVSSSVDIDAYIECNYVFLDEAERKSVASQSHDFLVERVYRIDKEGIKGQGMIDLIIQNPIKEIIWVGRRSDAKLYNTWNYFINKTNYPILNTAKLLWNGMERFEEKPEVFFNMIQPYKHHTRCPREGIYVYSFALYPEQTQPSGSFNASIINKVQMYITTNQPLTPSYDYEFIFYTPYYNVFRVMSGSGGMVFAN
jgi:hypothetical protein